jgi:hypothetical protein
MTTEEWQMIMGIVMAVVLALILFGVFDPKDK